VTIQPYSLQKSRNWVPTRRLSSLAIAAPAVTPIWQQLETPNLIGNHGGGRRCWLDLSLNYLGEHMLRYMLSTLRCSNLGELIVKTHVARVTHARASMRDMWRYLLKLFLMIKVLHVDIFQVISGSVFWKLMHNTPFYVCYFQLLSVPSSVYFDKIAFIDYFHYVPFSDYITRMSLHHVISCLQDQQ
jgi:hypothetical protein